MKASDLFVKALEAEQVDHVFGIPGEENLDLLESLRHSTIKLADVCTKHTHTDGQPRKSPHWAGFWRAWRRFQ